MSLSVHFGFLAVAGAMVILAAFPARGSEPSAAIELYIAPDGDDAASGGIEAPLATLEGARDRVRTMKNEGTVDRPVAIMLRAGVYRLTRPFTLSPEDSGTVLHPVTYKAYPGEEAVVSGGKTVAGWRQEGPLWAADLEHEEMISGLWVDGVYRHPARTPNEGFFYTAGKAPAPEGGGNPNGFLFQPGEIERWADVQEAIVVALHSWDTTHFRIESVDEGNHVVRFTDTPHWAFEHWGPKQRYFVEGIRAALDEPGEWYFDRSQGTLYYWPMEGEDPAAAEVVVPVAEQLLVLQGDLEAGRPVEFVHIEGLHFSHTNYPIGPKGANNAQAAYPVHAAIHANGARHCSIEYCDVAHISNYAIWFQQGCCNNRIYGNHLHDLGAGGIRIGDGADPASEHHVAAWNWVDNNWIHDGGKQWPASVGVWIGRSSYNTVSHNEISDLYYTGVSLGWSWGYAPSSANHNVIEYNHIHHIGQRVLSDMGGIYALGIAPGTILRCNLIHDVFSYSYGGWGIYPDEGSTDLLVENNLVYNVKTGGFHQHYGKENRVVNNIFAFSHEPQLVRSREEEHVSFFFERNIVYFNNGNLLGSSWSNGNFVMNRNCYWDSSAPDGAVDFAGHSFDEWREMGYDAESVIADPLFVNPEGLDFRLKPGSPAAAIGFKPFDASKAGLTGDKAWIEGPQHIERPPVVLPAAPEPTSVSEGSE
jgi:hypothetical protein